MAISNKEQTCTTRRTSSSSGHGPGGTAPAPAAPVGGPGDMFTMRLPGPPGFRRPGMRRGRRIRRGDVRAAILLLVEEEPRNGYQIMQELESRSGGVWRPSPGSVYPALQLLADEGLLKSEARDGGNVFELTDAGKAHVEENRERLRLAVAAGRRGRARGRARARRADGAGRRSPSSRSCTPAPRRRSPRPRSSSPRRGARSTACSPTTRHRRA